MGGAPTVKRSTPGAWLADVTQWYLWGGDKTKANIQGCLVRHESEGCCAAKADKIGGHQGGICLWNGLGLMSVPGNELRLQSLS